MWQCASMAIARISQPRKGGWVCLELVQATEGIHPPKSQNSRTLDQGLVSVCQPLFTSTFYSTDDVRVILCTFMCVRESV